MDVGTDGFMYALDLRGYIYKVDIDTGQATYIAETKDSTGSKIQSAMDIAFDADGNLFAVDGYGFLFEISLDGTTTAVAKQLGSTANNMLMGLIATPDNTLYGTNLLNGNLYSINKSTGVLTQETASAFTGTPHGGDAYIAYTGWPSTANAPFLATPTAGSIAETAGSSDTTTSGLSGTLSATDADGDTLSYAITGGSTTNGVSTLAGSYGSLSLNTSTGAYSYTPNSSAVEALNDGDSDADSFTVTASDGTNTTPATYTVNLTCGKEAGTEKIQSINNATTQNKISTFELIEPVKAGGKDITSIIIGTKKKEILTGTSSGEIITSMSGKDKIVGGGGADGFLFQDPNNFDKKERDTILDFNSDEGDLLLLDKDIVGFDKKPNIKKVKNKKSAKEADTSKADFIYEEEKGLLYFNENGEEDGWGDGGLFLKLKGAPELSKSDFTIV